MTGNYDARMRTLVKYITWLLHISWDDVEMFEEALVESLKEEEHILTE